jgi:HEAT repeat protein
MSKNDSDLCTDEEFDRLIHVLVSTTDHAERDLTALALADCGRIACVPALLKVLNDPRTKDHRSTLLYACSEYNCAEWVVDFVRIWITSDHAYDFHVLVVFDAMSNIPKELLDEAFELLSAVRADENDPLRRRIDAGRIMDHLALCNREQ